MHEQSEQAISSMLMQTSCGCALQRALHHVESACMPLQVKSDVDDILNAFCTPDSFTDSKEVSLLAHPPTDPRTMAVVPSLSLANMQMLRSTLEISIVVTAMLRTSLSGSHLASAGMWDRYYANIRTALWLCSPEQRSQCEQQHIY